MDLTIYIKDNCAESEKALELASFLKSLNPAVNLSIINVDRASDLDGGLDMVALSQGRPVYVLNGRIINLGNLKDSLVLREILYQEGVVFH